MSGAKSRWAEDEDDKQTRRQEKEAKKLAKLKRQRKQEEEAKRIAEAKVANTQDDGKRPAKRRRLSNAEDELATKDDKSAVSLLRFADVGWCPVRHVDNFERLNHIEEGSYGWVSRARETANGDIVALKKLKINTNRDDGFPVEAVREIQTLQRTRHRHVVELREVVMGDASNEVFLVMEFMEHDLRNLQEEMSEPFMPSETKTLLLQIVSGVQYLHDNWILHRDLKTSNILMNNRGEIKIADFGMCRQFSSPPPPKLTQLVVTLWYRSPELLLGTDKYDTAVDMWSVGCIFGELLRKEPLLQGRNEADQLGEIFALVGVPNDEIWPGFRRLPNAKALRLPGGSKQIAPKVGLRQRFPLLTAAGAELLSSLLVLNPANRLSADEVLAHQYFAEAPRPKPTALFPTFPSKAGGERRRKAISPKAPQRGDAPKINVEEFGNLFSRRGYEEVGGGFSLKLA